jgi:hypothetical protein
MRMAIKPAWHQHGLQAPQPHDSFKSDGGLLERQPTLRKLVAKWTGRIEPVRLWNIPTFQWWVAQHSNQSLQRSSRRELETILRSDM